MELIYRILFPIGGVISVAIVVIINIVFLIINIKQAKRVRSSLFSKEKNEAAVLMQIEMMQKCTVNTYTVLWPYKKYNFNFKFQEFMDYYFQHILPANNISQELKDAWVYQAKKSGIWKENS